MNDLALADDLFAGCSDFQFSHEGMTRQVFRLGEGPAVVLMHEVPGLHDGVVRLARRLADAGLGVWMPVLFGKPGVRVSALSVVGCMGKVCISREFRVLASRRSSPITDWLRALARAAHAVSPGPGVGVIGMCLTGGFGLAMMADPSVIAPVLANPSLPFALSPARAGALGIEQDTLDAAVRRSAEQAIPVFGLRFTGDPAVPGARFENLKRAFGERFVACEIDSSVDNPHGIRRWAHSVLGVSYVDEQDHPTYLAQEAVVAFLQAQLGLGQPGEQACKP